MPPSTNSNGQSYTNNINNTKSPQHNYKQPQNTNLDADVIFIHDSIGKHVKPGILSKQKLVTEKVLAYTQDQALSKIRGMKRTKAPKAVVVHVGTNDIRDNTDADTIVSKYEIILDEIGKMFPDTKIIMSNMIPRENADEDDELQRNVEYVNAVANRKLALKYDISLKNTDLTGKNKSQDGIHLNTTGVSKFACSIRDSVVAALDL